MSPRPSRRQIVALLVFFFGIVAFALHVAGDNIGAELLFGTLSAAVLAGYGWYELRRT